MYTRIHILVAAVAGAAAGAVAGYFVAQQRLATKYSEIAEQEIADARQYFQRVNKSGDYETPAKAVAALGIAVETVTTSVDPRPAVETLLKGMGYRAAKEVLEEIDARGPDAPYIIRQDEFLENDTGYEQLCLTYYVEDDTLAEQDDSIVDDVERMVGKANLDRFGGVSNDDNIVYVRNERMRAEYEVVRHHGSYKTVVLGEE
jgi:hypothetical protein